MLHLKELYGKLILNKDFRQGLALFSMLSQNSPGVLHQNRFWVVDILFPKSPFQRVGIFVWDNQENKLHGPFFLQKEDQDRTNFILEDYCFDSLGERLELHLFYQTGSLTRITVTGFEDGVLSASENS